MQLVSFLMPRRSRALEDVHFSPAGFADFGYGSEPSCAPFPCLSFKHYCSLFRNGKLHILIVREIALRPDAGILDPVGTRRGAALAKPSGATGYKNRAREQQAENDAEHSFVPSPRWPENATEDQPAWQENTSQGESAVSARGVHCRGAPAQRIVGVNCYLHGLAAVCRQGNGVAGKVAVDIC